jgi:hypothetical protein
MAEIKTNLRTFLLTNSVISTLFSTRVYVDHIPPEATLPHARITSIVEPYSYTMDNKPTRMPLIQIDIFDDDIVDCITARDAIKDALSGYSGQMGDIQVGFVFINDVRPQWNTDTDKPREILEVRIGTSD